MLADKLGRNKFTQITDEFALIRELTSMFTSYRSTTLVPNGDDAAIYKPTSGTGQIVCVDTLVEGVHFTRKTMSPYQIGYKSLAVNISDLAAMGGKPIYFLVAIAIPKTGWERHELVQIFQGMKQLADTWQLDLLGGDLVSSRAGLMITVTAIGEVDQRVKLLRSHAEPGHLLFTTGYLGQSAAGLDFLLHREERTPLFTDSEYELIVNPLLVAHQTPIPHVPQGQILAKFGLDSKLALNDVSDGLASETHEIATQSRVNIIIEKERLPLSPALTTYAQKIGVDPYKWIFTGGEDFVLVGTLPRELEPQVANSFQDQGFPFHIIGYIEEGEGDVWLEEQGKLSRLAKSGYNHFR